MIDFGGFFFVYLTFYTILLKIKPIAKLSALFWKFVIL